METQSLNPSVNEMSAPAAGTPETPVASSGRLHRRWDRMGRLVGDTGMRRLAGSHVVVIGLGGVGSWAAESLARAGVGTLTIVDFDQICVTNTNRQLHALTGMVGEFKAEVLAERFRKINPHAQVRALVKFYNETTSEEILGATADAPKPDFVIDAIDNVTAKCHLLASCRDRGIPVVSSSGSGGRLDPTQIRIADLAETEVDPLARAIRRILREKYGYPAKGAFGIQAVYSTEPVIDPQELEYDNGKGFKCVCPQGQNGLNDCDMKNQILGNAAYLTATFGYFCASVAIRHLIGQA